MRASDTPDIIETALIEGALEEIDERPPASSEHNPINRLEKEGFGKQVTEGVRKLHEEHATLPDGESAAEVVAKKVATIEVNGYAAHPVKSHYAETLTSEIEAYKGNWFNLQQERMSSPDFREKFEQFIEKHKPSLKVGEPSSVLQKPENFQSHYQSQLDEFDDNLERIGSSVGYGNAGDVGGKSAGSLGHGKIGETGTVYLDAVHQDGTPLTDEQKDIIAAHEAYHGMIDAQGSAVAEIKSGFDWNAYNELVDTTDVKQPSYLRNPDELTARMAQFKNYFGMQGGEQFTPDHLEYLRQHYLEDTGLDNGVSTMLKMVTPTTQKQFIELMNRLPV
ncbi:hypothetical protein KC952_00665 [Candidatus Saccharibacteria bacterium]|nr:hypothetical protein [Candidatus Saccharibacteria bacterium]